MCYHIFRFIVQKEDDVRYHYVWMRIHSDFEYFFSVWWEFISVKLNKQTNKQIRHIINVIANQFYFPMMLFFCDCCFSFTAFVIRNVFEYSAILTIGKETMKLSSHVDCWIGCFEEYIAKIIDTNWTVIQNHMCPKR